MHNKTRNAITNPVLREALDLVEEARNHFNHADDDKLDAAIYDLTAAELHLRAIIKKIRNEIPVLNDGAAGAQTITKATYPLPQLKKLRSNHTQPRDRMD